MIKNNLSKMMGERRLNIAELSEMSKVHRNTIADIYHDNYKRIDLKTLDRICDALDCAVGDIFEKIRPEKKKLELSLI